MSEKKKPSSPNKTGLVTRTAVGIAEGAKNTASAARAGAKTAADSGVKAALAGAGLAKKGAVVVWSGAKQVKSNVDQKTRQTLDAAYLSHRPAAATNVERLRKLHVGSTPAEIVKILEREYFAAEVKKGSDALDFIESTTTFVLSVAEIHGERMPPSKNRQALVDWLMVGNSKSATLIAEYGSLALLLIPKIPIPAIQKAYSGARKGLKSLANKDLAQKAFAFMESARPLFTKLGIKNPGRQSMGRIIASMTRKTFGPAPKTWPATKPTVAKKPTAAKPAAKKPAARKPKTSA